jgi:hypothetical protein
MSVFHHIDDILELPGYVFWRLASRLPAYQGAVTMGIERLREEVREYQEEHVRDRLYTEPVDAPQYRTPVSDEPLTADQLESIGPPAPELGEQVGLFEVTKCT